MSLILPLHGAFVEPADKLVPQFGLPAHQICATQKPRRATTLLALTAAERQSLEREINDLLSDPSLR